MKIAPYCLAIAVFLLPVHSFADPPKEYNVNISNEKKDPFAEGFKKGFEEADAEKKRLAEEKRIQEKLGPGYVVIVDRTGQTHIIKKDEK
jgi:hypothetical protein